ncbi:phospholipase D-like domain-containing protein [Bacillus taeanensis]|uniref:phospholipase D-like domain-containing protein n=1 Tax=Bacillus taeanensis TaxID=273032 RepID=UPI001FE3E69A|nr:phospholipase D-like domain-containing protein [Bacillus taeanensis]
MKKTLNVFLIAGMLFSFLLPGFQEEKEAYAAASSAVINEIAWMGTTTSYNDEWIELYNPTSSDIDLTGWTLNAVDGTPAINLSGVLAKQSYYLLERTSDNSVLNITADLIYTGSLSNSGENLELRDNTGSLVDSVDAWHAGDNNTKSSMERTDAAVSGTTASNWNTSTNDYGYGLGTPKAANSNSSSGLGSGGTGTPCTPGAEQLNNVSELEGAINVYFNKCALTKYASIGNEANYNVNLEDALINRLNAATTSIDLAAYEINLPRIIDTLITKAAQGVDVRVIADSKDATDPHYTERFKTMRLYVEKLVRGQDNVIGTSDDITVFSDSPMFAVEDSTARTSYGLPAAADDIQEVTVEVGSSMQTGRLFVDAEEKSQNAYYSPGNQMHNKFAIVDDRWLFTGSWNFTVTGLYGSEENMEQGILDGNQ